MDTLRILDAYCKACAEPTAHAVHHFDPGLAVCHPCGDEQQMVIPLAA